MTGVAELRPPEDCAFDLVSLGEVMLRLDPGERRIRTTRSLAVWEGGGEYNVARGLRRCFGRRTAVATALVDNEIGRLIEDLMLQGGVDQSLVQWRPFDGVGFAARNALNFVERGYGVRNALGVSDRAYSAASQLRPGDVDWEHLFGTLGVRVFHTGGIFTGLAPSTAELAAEAMASARRHGTVVSYDLNYRPSLWRRAVGATGRSPARVNTELVRAVDILFGNEEDFTQALGIAMANAGGDYAELQVADYVAALEQVSTAFPTLRAVAATLRTAHTATRNDWQALALRTGGSPESAVSVVRPRLEILDRVGGGDSFAAGFLHGVLDGAGLQRCVDLGAAHAALAMTTPGDTSMATAAEVERLAVGGGSTRVIR